MTSAKTFAFVVALASPILAQSPPRFEVASIKPCTDGDLAGTAKTGGRAGGREFSPGALRLDCTTVLDLIKGAYVLFADGHVNPRSRLTVEGGPAWIRSDRYRIDAKADIARSQGIMRGPMLQTLLEERFKLKIRRETRPVPAYALTAAKGGIKLKPFQKGSCTPLDLKIFEQFPPPPFPELPPGQKYCGGTDPSDGSHWIASFATSKGPNFTVEARAMSIDDFIKTSLSQHLDRPVLNKTGVAGLFDFHLEYAPDETMPDFHDSAPTAAGAALTDPPGPSIFTALQKQLGLKLEPAQGLGEFFVIDRISKPSGN